jgi:hypothetical protein
MQRWVAVGALVAALAGLAGGAARAETCSPAMCAGMSPVCWLAYQKIMVNKESKFASVDACKGAARDLEGSGSWLAAKGLTMSQAVCACEAAFWSLDSGMQGLPDILDTTQEDDNSDSY